jgi:hypothetical protein
MGLFDKIKEKLKGEIVVPRLRRGSHPMHATLHWALDVS